MTNFRRIHYSTDETITAMVDDATNRFVWVAFDQNSDGNCIIEKQAPFQPDQTYYSLEREVTKVNKMDSDTSNLYVAYEDDTLLGEKILLSNPLTGTTEISLPAGINESPIDVKVNSTDLWYLTPGNTSGEYAKLIKYTTSGTYVQTIDLSQSGNTVTNATSMTIDSTGDIWIVTYTDPAKLIRVYTDSGGNYLFTITNIE